MATAQVVKQIEARFADALRSLGFVPSQGKYEVRFTKNVTSEVEIYLFLGVERRKGRILIEPVIGMDYLPLRSALKELESKPTTQVCHSILGLLDPKAPWMTMELRGESIEEDALQRILSVIKDIAMPRLVSLGSAEGIRKLFEDKLNSRNPSGLVVMQEEIKLPVLKRILGI